MKSKILFAIGTLIVGGSLVTGYAITKADTKTDTNTNATPKEVVEVKEPVGEVKGEPIYDLKDFKVEKSEYLSLEEFVNDIAKNWAEGSEYRSHQDAESADWTLANSTLHYVNYFEKEIAEIGMTEDFNEWQKIAYDFTKADTKDKDLRSKFENKLNEIQVAFNFVSWELPSEGLLPADNEAYQNKDPNTIAIYENGYGFDKKSKRLILRNYNENGKPSEPTPEQYVGVIMGKLADIGDNPLNEFDVESNSSFFVDTVDQKLKRLNEMKQYTNGNKPLELWIDETINTLSAAKETEDSENRWELYNNGMNRIDNLQKYIGL